MNVTDVRWLEAWLSVWSDDDWEHSYGMQVNTLKDRPGWDMRVDLADTQFEGAVWAGTAIERGNHDWFECRSDDKAYFSRGGSWNFQEMIQGFRNWAHGVAPEPRKGESPTRFLSNLSPPPAPTGDPIEWFEAWYRHQAGAEANPHIQVVLETMDDPGWSLTIRPSPFTAGIEPASGVQTLPRGGFLEWKVAPEHVTIYAGVTNLEDLFATFRSLAEHGMRPQQLPSLTLAPS